MINLIFVNKSCQNTSFLTEISKGENIKRHIEAPKSESVRLERNLSYSALLYLTSRLYKRTPEDIDFSEKPRFFGECCGIKFNISHTDTAILIALTDAYGKIGVDIEPLMDREKAERIEKRFLSSLITPSLDLEIYKKINFFLLSADEKGEPTLEKMNYSNECDTSLPQGIFPVNISLKAQTEDETHRATAKFTHLESVLKCEGGGFGSIKEFEKIRPTCECVSFWILCGKREYSASLSLIK